MKRALSTLVATLCLLPSTTDALRAGESDGRLEIYWTDVEGGAATLIVTPAGESILFDTGMPGERDPGRIHRTVTERAGLDHIDHLIVTHFDIDHFGGVADLMKLIEVREIYDPGLPVDNPKVMERIEKHGYLVATAGQRQVVRAGDIIPLKQRDDDSGNVDGGNVDGGKGARVRLRCLGAAQKFIEANEEQKKTSNPNCASHRPKDKDLSQNANSTVFLLEVGPFRFFDGADLSWNLERDLVCPTNVVGSVDVFQIDHHGLDRSNNPVIVRSLEPRVVIFNNASVKGCSPATFRTVKECPSVDAIYQVHRCVRNGPAGNSFPRRIANLNRDCEAQIIKLSVAPDGKSYVVEIPSKGLSEKFTTRGN